MAVLLLDNSKKISRGKAQLAIGNAPTVEAPYARGPVKIEGLNIIAVDATREAQAALGKAQKLTVAAGNFNAEFKLTNTAKAMEALDACEKDLLVTWGMDPAIVASLASYPTMRGGIISILSSEDYPHAAIERNEQGTAGVRVHIGKDGKVSGCKVIESSGSNSIDEQTCNIIESRARFNPARTKNGEAVDSIALQRIRWELPE